MDILVRRSFLGSLDVVLILYGVSTRLPILISIAIIV